MYRLISGGLSHCFPRPSIADVMFYVEHGGFTCHDAAIVREQLQPIRYLFAPATSPNPRIISILGSHHV